MKKVIIEMKSDERINAAVGKRFREYREHKHATQDDIAKELGVAPNHYGRIERGENSCTIANLVTICNFLGINSNDVVGSLIHTSADDGISKEFNQLSLEDKICIKKYIAFLLSQYGKQE